MAKELGLKLPGELSSEAVDGGEKSPDPETGCGKEAEDMGSPGTESAAEDQQEQPVGESEADSEAAVSANSPEPVEENQQEEKSESEDSDRAASDAEAKESEVTAPGEAEASTANEQIKTETTAKESEKVESAAVIATSPTVLKSKGTWADIVSKPAVANGKPDTAVNGVANGEVEE